MSPLAMRTDDAVEEALVTLTASGRSRSEAARQAILDAAKTARRAVLRAEAESLLEDPEDVAQAGQLAAGMDAIGAC